MSIETKESNRCQGWRRTGGIFTFGSVKWVQCEQEAIVTLKFKENSNIKVLPACKACWDECLKTEVQIIEARPIAKKP